MLLQDYNEDRSLQTATPQEKESWSPSKMNMGAVAKVKVQTLSPFTSFSGGSFKMTSVKRMTATPDFLKMQKGDQGCQVEL